MIESELSKIKMLYEALLKIERFTEDMKDADDLIANDLVWDAVKMNLVVIAEMDIKIKPEIKKQFNSVDWYKIQENKPNIVSKYLGFDHKEIWKVLNEKLPGFKKQLEKVLMG